MNSNHLGFVCFVNAYYNQKGQAFDQFTQNRSLFYLTEKSIAKPQLPDQKEISYELRYHLNVLTYNYYSMKGEFTKFRSEEYIRQERMGDPEPFFCACLLKICNKELNPDCLEDGIAIQTASKIHVFSFTSDFYYLIEKDLVPKKMIVISDSEIIYGVKDNLEVKVESAKFTRRTTQTEVATFEAKGNHIYVFNQFQGNLYLFDDSNMLKLMNYDYSKRKHNIVTQFNVRSYQDMQIRQVRPFQKIACTSAFVYNKQFVSPFFDQQIKKPDELRLPDKFELPVLKKFLIEGPIISEQAGRLLYVTADSLGYDPSKKKKNENDFCFTAVIINFPDSNKIKLHTGKFDLKKPEKINTMILNYQNEIFVQMQKKFFAFEKSGRIICEIKNIKDDKCALKGVSPNGKFLALQFGDTKTYNNDLEVVKIVQIPGGGDTEYAFKKVKTVNQASMVSEFPHVNRVTVNADNEGNVHTFISGYLIQDTFDEEGNPNNKKNKMVFKYFQNGEDQKDKILSRFKCLDKIVRKTDIFGYFQNRFVFLIKDQRSIEYFFIGKSNNDQSKGQKDLQNMWTQTKTVDLTLDDMWVVNQIARTKDPKFVNITISSKIHKTTVFFTWDLLNNVEISSCELNDTSNGQISFGVEPGFHYSFQSGKFFDLELGLPFPYYKQEDIPKELVYRFQNNNQQRSGPLVAKNKDFIIAANMDSIFIPFNFLELLYVENLIVVVENPALARHDFNVVADLSRFCVDNRNIFHYFAQSNLLLNELMHCIMRQSFNNIAAKEDFFGILLRNNLHKTPFDIAVQNESPKCIELFLQMLNEQGSYSFSRHLIQHFDKLFEMGTQVFEDYLCNCFFSNKSMEIVDKIEWKHTSEIIYRSYHTGFMDQKFWNSLGKQSFDPIADSQLETLNTLQTEPNEQNRSAQDGSKQEGDQQSKEEIKEEVKEEIKEGGEEDKDDEIEEIQEESKIESDDNNMNLLIDNQALNSPEKQEPIETEDHDRKPANISALSDKDQVSVFAQLGDGPDPPMLGGKRFIKKKKKKAGVRFPEEENRKQENEISNPLGIIPSKESGFSAPQLGIDEPDEINSQELTSSDEEEDEENKENESPNAGQKKITINKDEGIGEEMEDEEENFEEAVQELIKNDMKKVELQAIEFDWIFRGKQAKQFVEFLGNTNNMDLFLIPSIAASLEYQWLFFQPNIRNKIFIPFLVYLCVFLVYANYILSLFDVQYNYKLKYDECQQEWADQGVLEINDLHCGEAPTQIYQIMIWVFNGVLAVFILFYLVLEVRQMIIQKCLKYFNSFWSIIDIISILLNGLIVGFSATNYLEIDDLRILTSIATLFMWIKFFYFLRLFNSTQNLIRIIQEICFDMGTFTLILFAAIFALANSFLLLAMNAVDLTDDNEDNDEPFTGDSLAMAFIYTFRTGLGDFDTDGFETDDEILLWIFFMITSILILLVLLNVLVAIMADTFDKVTERTAQSKFKEMAQMMSENEFVLDRESTFKGVKYVIVIQLEKADSAGNEDWAGKIGALKTFIDQKSVQTEKRMRVFEDIIKEDIGATKKDLEVHLGDIKQKTDFILKFMTERRK